MPGGCLPGGVFPGGCLPGGCLPEVCLSGGCLPMGGGGCMAETPLVNGITE